eukprot:TRINITY_DN20087_c0_g1_i1.p1 TRINITY_DN20087_c0_g1~~TRINITY_DN20087_c0_g1_i1.p1  ORF type:complete len:852 (-),score=157.65 TRINITY_DN20087_c0_g1_i1:40-2595(-)
MEPDAAKSLPNGCVILTVPPVACITFIAFQFCTDRCRRRRRGLQDQRTVAGSRAPRAALAVSVALLLGSALAAALLEPAEVEAGGRSRLCSLLAAALWCFVWLRLGCRGRRTRGECLLHFSAVVGRFVLLLAVIRLGATPLHAASIGVEVALLVGSLALPALVLGGRRAGATAEEDGDESVSSASDTSSAGSQVSEPSYAVVQTDIEAGDEDDVKGEALFPPHIRGFAWFREYYRFHKQLMKRAREINDHKSSDLPDVETTSPKFLGSIGILWTRVFSVAPLGQLAYGVFATTCLVIFSFAQPFMQGLLIDKALKAGSQHQAGDPVDMEEFVPYLGIVLFIIVGNYFAEVFQCVFFAIFGYTSVTRLRARMFANLMRQDMSFHDQYASGQLSSRLINDSSTLQNLLQYTLQRFINGTIMFFVALVAMFWTNPYLALTATLISPLNVLVVRRTGKLAGSYGAVQNDALATANCHAIEVLGAIRTAQSNTGEDFEAYTFRSKLQYVLRVIKATVYTENLFRSLQMAMQQGRDFVILILGLQQVIVGNLTIGTYTAFMAYVKQYESGFSQLAEIWVNIKQTVTSMKKFLDMLIQKPGIPPDDGFKPKSCRGEIAFDNVSFSYAQRPDQPVLSGVSFDASPGSIVALVGESGSGKSTIVRLLERYYDPTAGRILLDGHDYRSLSLRWLRMQIGLVEQEPVLFNRSIRENIAYGTSRGASEARIEEAARLANAHDFVSELPEGYDTQPGERAARISGGQKQRIAIARAVLRDPKVLVLDEATSALDSENEHTVQLALDNLMVGKTTIIIAHRLSTIARATRIVVLQNGVVVEEGTHKELSSKANSKFSGFMRHQMS